MNNFKTDEHSYSADYYKNLYIKPLTMKLGLSKLYYFWTAYFCLIKKAGLSKKSKVLDVGCGIGNLVSTLRKLKIKAYGIEPSISAKKYSVAPKFCLYGQYKKLPYPDNYFDLIFTNEVLEHIPENKIAMFIKELHRVSRGTMIHMICVRERGKIIFSDKTHLTLKNEKWWVNKFKMLGLDVSVGNIFYFFPNLFKIFTKELNLFSIGKGYFYHSKIK